MTSAEFAATYEKARPSALRLAARICGTDGEDIVQDVAVYFMERLNTYDRVTPALFLNLVANRARNRVKPEMGRNKYESVVGGQDELVLIEKARMPECGRRTPAAPRDE